MNNLAEKNTEAEIQSRRLIQLASSREAPAGAPESKISVRGLDFFYGEQQALFDNHLAIYKNRVTAIIGPSG